ncbi:MAG: hypothetical protein ACE5KA_02650 [Nitrososphaerales archaeon]
MSIYSWRDFGREAEFIVASYLKFKGWNIAFSPSSRGAADIVARKDENAWCIQVKSSMKSPHIRSEEIKRLKTFADSVNGLPVFASVQPWQNNAVQEGLSIGRYMIFLYSLDNWQSLQP